MTSRSMVVVVTADILAPSFEPWTSFSPDLTGFAHPLRGEFAGLSIGLMRGFGLTDGEWCIVRAKQASGAECVRHWNPLFIHSGPGA